MFSPAAILILAAGLSSFWVWLTMVLFLLSCGLLILTVLIQKPQGGGLAGAFGSGAGSGQTAFGARTGDALTVATIMMFCFFIVTALGLNWAAKPPKTEADAPAAQSDKKPAAPATNPATPATTPPPASPTPMPAATTPPANPPVNPPVTTPTPAPTPAPTNP